MYTFQTKAEVTQISLTGARLIVILSALMVAPRDLAELNSIISECGLVDKNYSADTIRIALSTLKAFGCKIARPCKTTNFKYKLLYHPFSLSITDEEINALKTLYSNMTRNGDYKVAIQYNELFNTLIENTFDCEVADKLRSITSFYKIDSDVYEKILAEDGKHNILTIMYASPLKQLSTKKFIFGRLFLKSNKLYVEGYDVNINKQVCYNLARIKEVVNTEKGDYDYKPQTCRITYQLRNTEYHVISPQAAVKKNNDGSITVEEVFSNKFFAIQHILSLGSDCTIIAPADVREEVINKLLELSKIYE